jgi:hypothetical protein
MYLGEGPTCHMRVFIIFVAAQFPNTINAEAMPGLDNIINSEHARKSTRGELAADLLTVIRTGAACQQELVIDLADVGVANARPSVVM